MTRYEKGHKDATHKRIVKVASERFRKDGIDGVGVAKLMADAGLTHGGFYAHFTSKEALIREAMAYAFSSFPADLVDPNDERPDLGMIIDEYLSPAHRDRAAKGCPLAALGPDLARRPRNVRTTYTKGLSTTMDRITAGLPETLSDLERSHVAHAVMAQMLGCLQLARLAGDKALSDRVLASGRRAAREIAGLSATGAGAKRTVKKVARLAS